LNALWEMPLKIRAADQSPMPEGMNEAIAMVFAGAPTYESALTNAVSTLRDMGYVFLDLVGGQVFQIPLDQWDEYVSHKYDFWLQNLPTSEALPSIVASGEVFLGPFLGYNLEAE
jgi:hypothetical protein